MKILVQVAGGCLTGLYVNGVPADEKIDVVLVDYDNENCDREDADPELDNWFEDGQTGAKFLEQVRINPEHYKDVTP